MTNHTISAETYKEEVLKHKMTNFGFLTVGQLRERIKNVPDDTPVFYQRVEDFYFEQNHWKSVELSWFDNETSEYIPAFQSYLHEDGFFVIDAHY